MGTGWERPDRAARALADAFGARKCTAACATLLSSSLGADPILHVSVSVLISQEILLTGEALATGECSMLYLTPNQRSAAGIAAASSKIVVCQGRPAGQLGRAALVDVRRAMRAAGAPVSLVSVPIPSPALPSAQEGSLDFTWPYASSSGAMGALTLAFPANLKPSAGLTARALRLAQSLAAPLAVHAKEVLQNLWAVQALPLPNEPWEVEGKDDEEGCRGPEAGSGAPPGSGSSLEPVEASSPSRSASSSSGSSCSRAPVAWGKSVPSGARPSRAWQGAAASPFDRTEDAAGAAAGRRVHGHPFRGADEGNAWPGASKEAAAAVWGHGELNRRLAGGGTTVGGSEGRESVPAKAAAPATAAALGSHCYQQVLLFLTFKSPQVEREFADWHNARKTRTDAIFTLVLLSANVCLALVARGMPPMLRLLGLCHMAQLGMLLLAPRAAYLRCREALCCAAALVQVWHCCMVLNGALGQAVTPGALHCDFFLAKLIAAEPMAVLALGNTMRLVWHVPTQLAALALVMAHLPATCSHVFPEVAARACKGWVGGMAGTVGLALPTLAVYLMERHARRLFVKQMRALNAAAGM